jgi:hypothetical protein
VPSAVTIAATENALSFTRFDFERLLERRKFFGMVWALRSKIAHVFLAIVLYAIQGDFSHFQDAIAFRYLNEAAVTKYLPTFQRGAKHRKWYQPRRFSFQFAGVGVWCE